MSPMTPTKTRAAAKNSRARALLPKFLRPRGPSGVMNASPSPSEREYELNTGRAEFGGWVLLIGLGIELVYGLFFSNWSCSEKMAIGAGNLLVVGGVWAEVHFGRKARIAGDTALETARARVAEAERETERIREKLAPRTLTPDQQQSVVEAISAFAGQRYSAVIGSGSPDAETFGLLLVEVLRRAGWFRKPHTGRLSSFPIVLGSRPGVSVRYANWEDEGTRTAADKLTGALGLAGIVAKIGPEEENPEPNTIKITIGVKPL